MVLKRDYPRCPAVEIYRCGCEIGAFRDNGERFRRETGLEDFVLCVGRLEWRKNQLMLLKALEDSELPLVFATGGFTYQPQYEEVCRKFQRRGQTVFLGRLAPDLLASAFAAARVHALPSWYELPGLVSLEAAHYNTNVVITDYGTARDYFEEDAFYCRPDDPQSIHNAVCAAYYSPVRPHLADRVAQYTWQRAADRNLEIYEQVLGSASRVPRMQYAERPNPVPTEEARQHYIKAAEDSVTQAVRSVGKISQFSGQAESEARILELCEEADLLVKKGEHDRAISVYESALAINPAHVRSRRGRGISALAAGRKEDAERYFGEALEVDPRDPRSLTCMGALQWAKGEREAAYDYFLRAAEISSDDLPTVFHLINASYEMNRLVELEGVLRRCLVKHRDNMELQYCLAGCYYRQGKDGRALGVLEHILQCQPSNEMALELKKRIDDRKPASDSAPSDLTPAIRLSMLQEAKRRKDYGMVIDKAEDVLNDPSASPSQRALAAILKGESRACCGDFRTAEEELRCAEVERTYAHRAISGRGVVCAAQSRWSEAETLFKQALALNREHDVALAGLGLCARNRGAREEAWDYFYQALEQNPENMQALEGAAELAAELGRLRDVEVLLDNYLEMNPADLRVLTLQAECLAAQGRVLEARDVLDKVLLLDPGQQRASVLSKELSGVTMVGAEGLR